MMDYSSNLTVTSGSGSHNPLHSEHTVTRRADEVEKIGQDDCLFTTSVKTPYSGWESATGTMFTLVPSMAMDILTFEFDATDYSTDLRTQVYYKPGDFSGATSDASQWTLLANTVAQFDPDGVGAIIPASDFTTASLNAGESYSFYLHFLGGNNVLKFTPASNLIGQDFYTDESSAMTLQVGVALTEGPFPSKFSEPAEFGGRIHYRTVQHCDSARSLTVVELEFAVDAEPVAELIADLSEAVQKAIDATVILDTELIKYSKFHSMEIVGVESAFMGRSEEKCPVEFKTCSLIFARVGILHLPTVTAGELQLQLLSNEDKIGESVVTQSDFVVEYVGDPVTSMDFVITLKGDFGDGLMNTLQRRYFETVTASFLDETTDIPIYTTSVIDVSSSNSDSSDNGRERQRRGLGAGGLRGTRRVQSVNSLAVATTVFGSGTGAGLRAAVLEGLGFNEEQYINDLATIQLRPGEINIDNSGDMFADLQGAVVIIRPNIVTEAPAPVSAGDGSSDDETNIWIAVFIGCIALSLFWLAFRLYRDCFSAPKDEYQKLTKRLGHIDNSDVPESSGRGAPMEGRRPPLKRAMSWDGPVRPEIGRFSQGRLPVGSTHSVTPSRNEAGSRGRGVRPTKSMPMGLMKQPVAVQRHGEVTESGNQAGSSTHVPTNQAGQCRGIQPTRSMPMLKGEANASKQINRSQLSRSAHGNRPTNGVDANQNPAKNQAGQKRGVQPSRSMPMLKDVSNPSKQAGGSQHSRSSHSTRKGAQNLAGQKRGIQANRSMPSLRETGNSPRKLGESQHSKSSHGSRRAVLSPNTGTDNNSRRNQAGQKRGVQSSRSLPMLKNGESKVVEGKSSPSSSKRSTSSSSVRSFASASPNTNQAGTRRGIQPSRSLPNGPLGTPPSKPLARKVTPVSDRSNSPKSVASVSPSSDKQKQNSRLQQHNGKVQPAAEAENSSSPKVASAVGQSNQGKIEANSNQIPGVQRKSSASSSQLTEVDMWSSESSESDFDAEIDDDDDDSDEDEEDEDSTVRSQFSTQIPSKQDLNPAGPQASDNAEMSKKPTARKTLIGSKEFQKRANDTYFDSSEESDLEEPCDTPKGGSEQPEIVASNPKLHPPRRTTLMSDDGTDTSEESDFEESVAHIAAKYREQHRLRQEQGGNLSKNTATSTRPLTAFSGNRVTSSNDAPKPPKRYPSTHSSNASPRSNGSGKAIKSGSDHSIKQKHMPTQSSQLGKQVARKHTSALQTSASDDEMSKSSRTSTTTKKKHPPLSATKDKSIDETVSTAAKKKHLSAAQTSTPLSIKNASGTKGRGIVASKSLPTPASLGGSGGTTDTFRKIKHLPRNGALGSTSDHPSQSSATQSTTFKKKHAPYSASKSASNLFESSAKDGVGESASLQSSKASSSKSRELNNSKHPPTRTGVNTNGDTGSTPRNKILPTPNKVPSLHQKKNQAGKTRGIKPSKSMPSSLNITSSGLENKKQKSLRDMVVNGSDSDSGSESGSKPQPPRKHPPYGAATRNGNMWFQKQSADH